MNAFGTYTKPSDGLRVVLVETDLEAVAGSEWKNKREGVVEGGERKR